MTNNKPYMKFVNFLSLVWGLENVNCNLCTWFYDIKFIVSYCSFLEV